MESLTKEQREFAYRLASIISAGVADLSAILLMFEEDKEQAEKIIHYWYDEDDTTRNAINILVNYKNVQFLESCLKRRARNYID